jgi:hypothetical protein
MAARRITPFIALLALPISSSAGGGWATLTIERLPDHIETASPLELSFIIRPHGFQPHNDLHPSAHAAAGSEQVVAEVKRGARPGQYIARLPIERAGEWQITLRDGITPVEVQLLPMEALAPGGRPSNEVTTRLRGQRLFVAKGCFVCHQHAEAAGSGLVRGPPALTSGTLAAAYIRSVIADPTVAPRSSSTFRMPSLEVDAAEMEALVEFLGTPPRKAP